MRPLNFLHLTTFYPPYSFGGDAMYLYRLCHNLADMGHHVEVIHCVDSFHLLHPGEPKIKFAEHPGVVRHELRRAGLSATSTGSLWARGRFVTAIFRATATEGCEFPAPTGLLKCCIRALTATAAGRRWQ